MGPEPAQPFIEDVPAAADPARAERDRKTHTSTRPHWGITMPQLEHAVKRHAGCLIFWRGQTRLAARL